MISKFQDYAQNKKKITGQINVKAKCHKDGTPLSGNRDWGLAQGPRNNVDTWNAVPYAYLPQLGENNQFMTYSQQCQRVQH